MRPPAADARRRDHRRRHPRADPGEDPHRRHRERVPGARRRDRRRRAHEPPHHPRGRHPRAHPDPARPPHGGHAARAAVPADDLAVVDVQGRQRGGLRPARPGPARAVPVHHHVPGDQRDDAPRAVAPAPSSGCWRCRWASSTSWSATPSPSASWPPCSRRSPSPCRSACSASTSRARCGCSPSSRSPTPSSARRWGCSSAPSRPRSSRRCSSCRCSWSRRSCCAGCSSPATSCRPCWRRSATCCRSPTPSTRCSRWSAPAPPLTSGATSHRRGLRRRCAGLGAATLRRRTP